MCREYMTVTISSRKNYNVLALRGEDIDDMEVVQDYGLDPKLAYTPGINTAMLDKIEKETISRRLEKGQTEAEARTMARNNRRAAEASISKLLKK